MVAEIIGIEKFHFNELMNDKIVVDRVDYSIPLEDSSNFTVGWILESLRKNDKNFAKFLGNREISDVTFSDISGGKGFLSAVLRIVLTFVDSKNAEDIYSTILKIPGPENLQQIFGKSEGYEVNETFISKIVECHRLECKFYAEIAPNLEIPLPKIFKTKFWVPEKMEKGCIHMEDLSKNGTSLNYFESATVEQVKNVVKHLAHMHYQVLNGTYTSWKGKYIGGEMIYVEAIDMLASCLDDFLACCSQKDLFIPYISKYKKLMLNKNFVIYAFNEAPKELGIPPVIVHGDLWGGNIMWHSNEPKVLAFLDWQVMHEGSPMNDIARFLGQNCSGKIRREIEENLIEFYFNRLKDEMDGTEMPYTKKQLQKMYDIRFVLEAFLNFILFKFAKTNCAEISAMKKAELKILNAMEDMDFLLEGRLKFVFERFG